MQCKPLHCHHFKLFLRSLGSSQNPFSPFFSQGRGYPDIPTRRWKLSLSVYNVSHHIAIYVTYHFVFMYLFGLSVNICICTNRFLQLLIEKLCLPTYCLVDCDPYGFDILTTYRFGSMVRFIKLLMILLFIYLIKLNNIYTGNYESRTVYMKLLRTM